MGIYGSVSGGGRFVDSGGHFSTIQFPGTLTTGAPGINDAGEIVGTYEAFEGGKLVLHGFFDIGHDFLSLTFPGAI